MSDDIDPKPDKKAVKAAPREHDILTNEEVAEIKKAARAKLEKERHDAAKKQFMAEETQRLRQEEGMVVGGVKDEMVDVTITLPIFANRILVNNNAYWHGQTYRVPRHVAESLKETMWRGYRHQEEIEGHDMTSMYAKARETVLSPVKGVINAPKRFDA